MSRRALCAAALIIAVAAVAVANPIPSGVIDGMNNLARRVPDGLTAAERADLVGLMGSYGFGFWDPDVRALVAANLDVYCPLLVECQAPGHSVDFELQRWFRSVAPDTCREAMRAVLHRWITETPPPAGRPGFSPDAWESVQNRVAAAEVLSDCGDTTAAPLVRGLIASPASAAASPLEEERGSYRWHLRQALTRLRDPDAAAILDVSHPGRVRVTRDVADLQVATFGQPFNSKYPPAHYDVEAARRLVAMLGESTVPADRHIGSSGIGLNVEFADGASAHVYVGHRPGQVVYEDNTRLEHPTTLLDNGPVYAELEALRTGGYVNQWRGAALLGAIQAVLDGTDGADDTFVRLVGGDNTRFFKDDAFALLEQHFDALAPLVVRAQMPVYVIDRGMQAWYWDHADAAQREAMLAGLRHWLTDALPEAEGTRLGSVTDIGSDLGEAFARVRAAEVLADYGDRAALPLIESVSDALANREGGLDGLENIWVEIWWYLREAAIRVEDPAKACLCMPRGADRLDVTASPDEIAVARVVSLAERFYPEMPLDAVTAAEVIALIEEAVVLGTSRTDGWHPPGNSGVMIAMSDGREFTLSGPVGRVLYCSDNTRRHRWVYELEHPGLVALLADIRRPFEQQSELRTER